MSLRTDIIQSLDPVELWRHVLGCDCDEWQQTVLRSPAKRTILCCARQVGKSQTVAIKALHLAMNRPKSLVLLVSRSLRQSVELGRKVFDAHEAVGHKMPPEAQSKLALELVNGSRILCLPGGDDSSIRGFSATSVIIDEAARCPDALFVALRPSLAVGNGSLTLLSTPFGRRGFFWRVWSEAENWLKIEVKASQCSRLSPTFLAEERRELGPRWYAAEYECAFLEAVGQLFADEAIDAAFRDDITPLFPVAGAAEDALLTDVSPLFMEDR
jgi:Terminase large subunit, T4likevirus-type, N-terminal